MIWRRRSGEERTQAREVVAEAESLLAGHMFGLYGERNAPVWAVVGSLAHGDRRQLQGYWSCRHLGGWFSTLGHLANEILAKAPSQTELLQIQREVFIPLELAILDRGGELPSTPPRLTVELMEALDRYQMHRDR